MLQKSLFEWITAVHQRISLPTEEATIYRCNLMATMVTRAPTATLVMMVTKTQTEINAWLLNPLSSLKTELYLLQETTTLYIVQMHCLLHTHCLGIKVQKAFLLCCCFYNSKIEVYLMWWYKQISLSIMHSPIKGLHLGIAEVLVYLFMRN